MLAFLLLLGYAAMGFALDHQEQPVHEQGFPSRAGWPGEAGLGVAFGWALAVACVLPLVVGGGIAIVLLLGLSAWGWLVVDVAFFALAALAEEIAFRGYGFQRFAHAVGPAGAAVGFAFFYAIVQTLLPGSGSVTFTVSLVFSLLLSTAYLRTHALWVSWGINFGWKASRALLFGLAIGGDNSHSPVVQGNPMGPFWLTGGGFGLDSSWVTLILMLAALPVVFRLTREMNGRYNAPKTAPEPAQEVEPEPVRLPVDPGAATPSPANPEPPSNTLPQ
jgi:membrane protease YdiL (CAAX protease family)